MPPDYHEFLQHCALAAFPSEHLIGLVRSAGQGTSERVEAAMILGYRRSPQAITALAGMMRDGWHADSVAAAEALAKIGGPGVVPHVPQVCDECRAICTGTHLHWDANRLLGVLGALLQLRAEAELKR